jgi:hypothetical protein
MNGKRKEQKVGKVEEVVRLHSQVNRSLVLLSKDLRESGVSLEMLLAAFQEPSDFTAAIGWAISGQCVVSQYTEIGDESLLLLSPHPEVTMTYIQLRDWAIARGCLFVNPTPLVKLADRFPQYSFINYSKPVVDEIGIPCYECVRAAELDKLVVPREAQVHVLARALVRA